MVRLLAHEPRKPTLLESKIFPKGYMSCQYHTLQLPNKLTHDWQSMNNLREIIRNIHSQYAKHSHAHTLLATIHFIAQEFLITPP